MKPEIPKDGFFAALKKAGSIKLLQSKLEAAGFNTFSVPEENILMASYHSFEGQGLWSCEHGCVCYDLDLTNMDELKSMTGQTKDDAGELIWALYRKYDLAFIEKLRGLFGFSFWDRDKKKMVVVTDHYGIKPVVWWEKNGEFVTASRIKTLLQDQTILREINPDAVYHYMFYHAVCSPISIYKGIHKLEPGRLIQVVSGNARQQAYYDIQYNPDFGQDQDYWERAIFERVQKAVDISASQSPYDRTGCFLSGGTDSSTVAGMYGISTGKPARTFSIGFDDERYNELDFAHIAVDHFKTIQTDYIVTPQDTLDVIHLLPLIYDEPFGNGSVIPAFYCAKAAKEQGLDTLIGGDGGDEIFGGNERYVTNLVFQRYHRIPGLIRRMLLEPALRLTPDSGIFHKVSRYVRRANFPNPYRFYSYNLLAETDNQMIFNPEFLQETGIHSFMDIAQRHYDTAAPADETDRLLYLDMKFTITDNDLRKVNLMTEACGVRVHYPYLDQDLVEFTCTIPPNFKVRPGKNRYIFKQAMKNFLPKQIIEKSKHGMGMPISNWFRTEKIMSEYLNDNLFSGRPRILDYIRKDFLDSIRKAFEADGATAYYGDTLWVYLIFELWLNKNPN